MIEQIFQLLLSLKDDKTKLDYKVCTDGEYSKDGMRLMGRSSDDSNHDKKSEDELKSYINRKPIKITLTNLDSDQKQFFTNFMYETHCCRNTNFWYLMTYFGIRRQSSKIKPEFQEEYDRLTKEYDRVEKERDTKSAEIKRRVDAIFSEYVDIEYHNVDFDFKTSIPYDIPSEFYEIHDIPDTVEIDLDSRSDLYQRLQEENFFDYNKLKEQLLVKSSC